MQENLRKMFVANRTSRIILSACFQIKIKAPQLWQYKLAFLSSDRGPTLKTHDEKRAVFQAFVDQFVKT